MTKEQKDFLNKLTEEVSKEGWYYKEEEDDEELVLAPCGHNYNKFDNTTCAKPGCPGWKEE